MNEKVLDEVTIDEIQLEAYKTAASKGWVDAHKELDFGSQLMLIVGELSEALEEYRKGKGIKETYYVDGKPEGIPIELADVIIRTCYLAELKGINLENAINEKLLFNQSRPRLHGGKKI